MCEVKPGLTKSVLAPVSGWRAHDRVDDRLERRELVALPLPLADLVEDVLELRPAVVDGVQRRQELLERRAQRLERGLLVGEQRCRRRRPG